VCRSGAVDGAVALGLKKITPNNIHKVMETTGGRIFNSLTPAQKKIVEYIRSRGQELTAVDKKTETCLGMTKPAVYQHIDYLLKTNAIVEVGGGKERVWHLNPAVSAYLKSSKRKKSGGEP
jgi:hypothetical protein